MMVRSLFLARKDARTMDQHNDFQRHQTKGSSSALEQPLPEPRAYKLLLGMQVLFGISYSAFLLLPKFLTVELGASPSEVGAVAALSLVAAALSAPFMGALTARWGRQALAYVGFSCEACASLLFSQVQEVGPLLLSLRILQGLAFTCVFHVTLSATAEIMPQSKMARYLGFLGLSMLITNALAPLVVEPLAEFWGFRPAFVAVGLLSLCALPLIAHVPRGHRPCKSDDASLVQHGSLFAVFLASGMMGAGIGVMFTFTQPFALSLGAERVGDFFIGYVGAAVSVRLFCAGVADFLGPRRVAVVALFFYALSLGATSMLEPAFLLPLGIGLGISHGLLYPALTARGLELVRPGAKDRFMGYFAAAFNSGFAVSAIGLGIVVEVYGYRPVYLLVATGLLFATGALARGQDEALLTQQKAQYD
ncbi:MAG: MFS transporter [Polyangiaceae bacterium]|nr:MFS transporter [Polyangiaceae bacterium]